ncbi:MAG: hydantoinase B/oxoprolinase family protein [Planctomycetales bacterium]|nr:hydantoinase B/oxoprolinase family protein [Planctomycetales bacterium]
MDPIQFEVLRSSFAAMADEMAAALRKAAFSTNIKTRADFSCALFDRQMRVIAQSFSQPIHLASMARLVPLALQKYGSERLGPGDVLATNDSHNGSMHLNDVCLIAPAFHHERLLGYVAAVAHHVDIGGMAPGGLCVSREIYQEGIIIPAVKLLAAGQVVDDLFQLILANIRSPRQTAGDIRAQIAAVRLGEKRFAQIADQYSEDAVESFTDELIEYTARWATREIAELPEGTYKASCWIDDDGIHEEPIRLCLAATVRDGRVSFDLTGSEPQRAGAMNASLTYSYSAVSYVVKCLIDSDVPTNEGFYRLIDVHAPAATVVNAQHPVGVVGGNDIALRLCDLGFRAFAEAVPEKVVACSKSIICNMGCGGIDPRTGEYYTFMETIGGGYGGRRGLDGLDAVQPHIQNTENSAIEETENQYPLRILRYELVTDSEGPGEYRGGLGVRRDWQFVDHEATVTVFSDQRKYAPWGLFGGGDGAASRYVLDPQGVNTELSSKVTLELERDQVLSYRTPGGGGYGDPRTRDPALVLADYLAGKITAVRALEEYAVAIDESIETVDEPGTAELRGE